MTADKKECLHIELSLFSKRQGRIIEVYHVCNYCLSTIYKTTIIKQIKLNKILSKK